MKHVFISYKRDDGDFVENLRSRLNIAGLPTWDDSDIQAGEEWKPAIDNAIRDSFAVVVVMTPAARQSEYVTYEWSFAMGLSKDIVPILLKPTDLHPKLSDLQHLDFSVQKNRPWDLLQKRLNQIRSRKPTPIANSAMPQQTPQSKFAELVKQLEYPTPQARVAAARVLGDFRAREAVQKLIPLLNDDDESVRMTVAEALGKIRDDAATPALMALVGRPDLGESSQHAAINALADLGSRQAIIFLYKEYKKDPEDEMMRNALIDAVANHSVSNLKNTIIHDLNALGQEELLRFRLAHNQLTFQLSEEVNKTDKVDNQTASQIAAQFKERVRHLEKWKETLTYYLSSVRDFSGSTEINNLSLDSIVDDLNLLMASLGHPDRERPSYSE